MVRSGHRRRGVTSRSVLSGLVALALITMLTATAVLAARPAAVAAQDDASVTAAVAPEDALVYVRFTLDPESAQWQQAAALLERAGFGATIADLQKELFEDTGAGGGAILQEIFLGGEGALVITGAALDAASGLDVTGVGDIAGVLDDSTPEAGSDEPVATGVAFILEPRSPGTAFAAVQDALADQAVEEGAEVVESEYEGVPIQFAPGGEADENNFPLAIAQVDDLILLGGAPADLEPIIDTSQGTTSPLSEFVPFAEVQSALGEEESLLSAFVNGVAASEGATDASTLGVFADTAGTEQYNGLVVRADTAGLRMETVTLPAEGTELPPAAPAFEPAVLERVPSDTLFFLDAFDLGQTGLLDALGLLLVQAVTGSMGGAATPSADQSADDYVAQQYEAAAGLLGFNLQTDLIRQFVGEYAVAVSGDEDPANLSALFVTGVGDAGTVTNALSDLANLIEPASSGSATVTTRQADGAEITVIEPTDPSVAPIEYGVVDDQFLLGYGPAIDDYLAGPDESLADDEQFRTVLAELPAEGRNGLLYVDLAQIIPLVQTLAAADGDEEDAAALVDADPACGDYATQEEAQAAYDEDVFANSDLDTDSDGEACEDFFAPATPEADVEAEASPVPTGMDFSAVRAFALVAYEEENMRRSSAILYIEE